MRKPDAANTTLHPATATPMIAAVCRDPLMVMPAPSSATGRALEPCLPGLGRNLSLPAAVAADYVQVPLERMRPADEHIGRSAPGTARPLSLVGRLDPVGVRR